MARDDTVEFDIKALDKFSRTLKKFDRRMARSGMEVDKARIKIGKQTVYLKAQRRATRTATRDNKRYHKSMYDVGLAATKTGWKLNKFTMGLKSSRFQGSLLASVLAAALAAGFYAVGRAMKSATKEFASYEHSIVKAAMRQDNFTESQKQFRSAAIRAGAASKFSAGEAAAGLEKLSSAGLSANASMAMLGGTLSLATIAEMTPEKAADVATGIMAAFQLPIKELSRVNDALAFTATKTKTTVGELGTAMEYAGTVAGQFGLEVEEVVGALGMMAQANIRGEKAGTAFRGMLMKLANPSKEGQKMLDAMGVDVWTKDVETGSKKLKSFVEIVEQFEKAQVGAASSLKVFMQRAGPGFAAIFGGSKVIEVMNEKTGEMEKKVIFGSEALRKFTEEMKEAKGAAKEMEDKMLGSLTGQMQLLGGAFDTVKILAGEFIGAGLRPVVKWLYDLMIGSLEVESSVQRLFRWLATEASDHAMFFGDYVKAFIVWPLKAAIWTFSTVKMGVLAMAYSFNRLHMAAKHVFPAMKRAFRSVSAVLIGLLKFQNARFRELAYVVVGEIAGIFSRVTNMMLSKARTMKSALSVVLSTEQMQAVNALIIGMEIAVDKTDDLYMSSKRARWQANKNAERAMDGIGKDLDKYKEEYLKEVEGAMKILQSTEQDILKEVGETEDRRQTLFAKLDGLVKDADALGKDIAAALMKAVRESKEGLLSAKALEEILKRLAQKTKEYEPAGKETKKKIKDLSGYYIFMEASLKAQDPLMKILYEHHAKRSKLAAQDMELAQRRYEERKLEMELEKKMNDLREKNHGFIIDQRIAEVEANQKISDYQKEIIKIALERRRIAQQTLDPRQRTLELTKLQGQYEKAVTEEIKRQREERNELLKTYQSSMVEGFSGFGEGMSRIANEEGGGKIDSNNQQIAGLQDAKRWAGKHGKKALEAQISGIQRENEQIRKNIELHERRTAAIEKASLATIEMGNSLYRFNEFGEDTKEGAEAMASAMASVNQVSQGFMDAIGIGAKKQAKILAIFNLAMAAFMTAMAIGNPGMAGVYGTSAAKHLFAAGKFGLMASMGGAGIGGGGVTRMQAPQMPDDRGKEDLARLIGEELRRNDRQRADKALIIDLRNAVIAGESPEAARILGNLVRPELQFPGR